MSGWRLAVQCHRMHGTASLWERIYTVRACSKAQRRTFAKTREGASLPLGHCQWSPVHRGVTLAVSPSNDGGTSPSLSGNPWADQHPSRILKRRPLGCMQQGHKTCLQVELVWTRIAIKSCETGNAKQTIFSLLLVLVTRTYYTSCFLWAVEF